MVIQRSIVSIFVIIGIFSLGIITQTNYKDTLIAFWDFNEENGIRISKKYAEKKIYSLREGGDSVKRIKDGPISGYSALLNETSWLFIPRDSLGDLNIYGKDAKVTVIAWIKKHSEKKWQAIAGVWDESRSKRQYCLFMNASLKTNQNEMKRYPASKLLHGHISASGGKSPGEQAWISYASSQDSVPLNKWVMIGMTYDGSYIKVYIDGKLSYDVNSNPFKYEDGIFDGETDGADFTVGANSVRGMMTNNFIGQIGGLAIFNNALSEKEILKINQTGSSYFKK